MKIGIIRCRKTENYCPGTTDFKSLKIKSGSFSTLEGELELVGFVSCAFAHAYRSETGIWQV